LNSLDLKNLQVDLPADEHPSARNQWTGLSQLLDQLNCHSVAAVSSALSPKTWPFSLEWLPQSAYLVGGTVRDALLERESDYLDLDFVMPAGAVETAQAIARHYKAGFVLLDAERQIARVVFPQGTVDFAQQVGPSLEADLARRDFTVNAIAYNPHTDQILDPLQGYADLQKRLLRMVSPENLREDPLRLLRAYRQAAQLGFALEPATRSVIQQLSPFLRQIAAERVQSELNYLLSTAKGTPWLTAAWQDGLLQDWFPGATLASLEQVAAIDATAQQLEETCAALWVELVSPLRMASKTGGRTSPDRTASDRAAADRTSPDPKPSGSTRTWLTTAKLASLLPSPPAAAEAQLRKLKYSRTEIQAASTVLKFLPQLQVPETAAAALRSPQQQYFFFQAVGPAFPAIAVAALALSAPTPIVESLSQHFLCPSSPIAHPTALVTGQDLMTALKIPPGPHIGRLLADIQLARAEGQVSSAIEALEWARLSFQSSCE
jgi:tRNA nucleotidyltransferase (CCA-adding enzyme)